MWFDPTVVRAIRDLFPEWMAIVFAFLSFFGSIYFVAPVIVLGYWWLDHRRFVDWIAFAFGGYAIMVAIKGLTDVSRPPVGPAIDPASLPTVVRIVYEPLLIIDTTSFPSGHAIAATIVWTMFYLETDIASERIRGVIAIGMIGLVSLARVAGGIHFPIDVIAGVAIGAVYLVLAFQCRSMLIERIRDRAVVAMFVIAAAMSTIAYSLNPQIDTLALVGGALGAAIAWERTPPPRDPWPRSIRTVGFAGLSLTIIAVLSLSLVLIDTRVTWFGLSFLGGAFVIGLPSAFDRIAGRSN